MKRLAACLIALLYSFSAVADNYSSGGSGGGGGGGTITFPATVAGIVNSGGIPCFTGTTTMASSALLSANAIVIGGGVGACPTTTTTGLNVLSTLAVAVNATGGIISPTPTRAGDIIYWSGTAWITLAGNNAGTSILEENASGVPSWVSATGSGVTSLTTTCPPTGPSTGSVTLTNGLQILTKTGTYNSGSTPAPSAGDCGAIVTFTISSAATYQLPSPAVMGTGYGLAAIQNAAGSTANLTLTPAAGTIAGASSLILPPNSSIPVWTDGTNYFSGAGVGQDTLVFTATGTWTPNPSLVRAIIGCIGGGGGGGGGGADLATGVVVYGGGGGGAGSGRSYTISAGELRSLYAGNVTVTITAGGNGGAGNANTTGSNGSTGGTSVVGSGSNVLCQGFGGGGGGGGGTTASGGGGGAGLSANGSAPTANTNAGGNAGAGGGTAGVGGAGVPGFASWCAGPGANGGTTTTTAAKTGTPGLCSSSGAAGGGVTVGGSPAAGATGIQSLGVSTSNTIYSGGAVASAGGTGMWSDGTFVINGIGLVGGGSAGSGAGCIGTGTGCTPGNGGAGGYGSGGGGGGGMIDPTVGGTGGTGGAGGAPVAEIIEINNP